MAWDKVCWDTRRAFHLLSLSGKKTIRCKSTVVGVMYFKTPQGTASKAELSNILIYCSATRVI